jgi:hypothetical protein
LAVIVAVVPAWSGTRACSSAMRAESTGAAPSCCLPESDLPPTPCCCEAPATPPESGASVSAPGCDCSLSPDVPERRGVSPTAETALERELRARFAAAVTALVVAAPLPAPHPLVRESGEPPGRRDSHERRIAGNAERLALHGVSRR